jgi:hypothetical protein
MMPYTLVTLKIIISQKIKGANEIATGEPLSLGAGNMRASLARNLGNTFETKLGHFYLSLDMSLGIRTLYSNCRKD